MVVVADSMFQLHSEVSDMAYAAQLRRLRKEVQTKADPAAIVLAAKTLLTGEGRGRGRAGGHVE